MCITGVLKWYCPGCSKIIDTETKDRICEDNKCPYKTKSYRGPLPIADAQVASSEPCKDCTEPKSGVHRSKSGSAAGPAAGRGSRESNSSRIYTINSDYQHFPSTYTTQRSERPEGSRGASGKSNTQQQSRRAGAGGESSRTREYIPTPSHADRDYLKVPSDDRRGGYGSGSSSHTLPNSSSSRRSGQDDNEPRDGESREDWYKRVTGSASGYRAYAERTMSGQGSSYRSQGSGGRRDSAATVTPRSYPESMPPAYSSRGNGSAHGGSAHGGSAHGASAHGASAHGASARHGESAYGGSGRGGSAHGGSRQVAQVRHGYASPAGSPPRYSQIYPSDSISSVGASSYRASSVGTSSVGSMSSFGGSSTSTASTSRRDNGIQIVINMG